ncbi:MAG: hypothetical protein R3E87_24200 [Burkholderiaceae bacterium]
MPRAERPRVFIKLARATLSMASVRYRALLPAVVLESRQRATTLVTDDSRLFNPRRFDALVIVKSFAAQDQALASRARSAGRAVVFDLCDNIYVPGYKTKSALPAPLAFYQIACRCDLIVCSTEPLRQRVERQLGDMVPVLVIPDGLESETTRRAQQALLTRVARSWRAQLSDRLRALARLVRARPSATVTATAPNTALPAPPAHTADQPAGAAARHRILWFGNHGAPYGHFGMRDILLFREALDRLAAEFDVELVVVSNSRAVFQELADALKIRSHYREWSPAAVSDELSAASAVIVPNSFDEFAICKSANRTALALMHGVPVIANATPTLEPLRDGIWLDDPYDGLAQSIAEPARARARAATGLQLCQRLFSDDTIAELWSQALRHAREAAAKRAGTVSVGLVLDLAQDWDVATGVIDRLRAAGLGVHALVSHSLATKLDSRTIPNLIERRIPLTVLPDKFSQAEAMEALGAVKALISFAESSLRPHRFANRLAKFAKGLHIVTATVQHGYENVGLTYSDSVHPVADVQILSDIIFTWGPLTQLHDGVTRETRERCVPAGCPKPARPPVVSLPELEREARPVIGLFENLHWHRYSDRYREAFLDALSTACSALPDVVFLLKPHHAGRWLTDRYKGPTIQLPNLLIADPMTEPWSRYTAPQLFSYLAGVVTTPSTVALDAARYGLPVAVTRFDLDLPQYEPLPQIADADDLVAFVRRVSATGQGRDAMLERMHAFVDRAVIPGDGATFIASTVASRLGIQVTEVAS